MLSYINGQKSDIPKIDRPRVDFALRVRPSSKMKNSEIVFGGFEVIIYLLFLKIYILF